MSFWQLPGWLVGLVACMVGMVVLATGWLASASQGTQAGTADGRWWWATVLGVPVASRHLQGVDSLHSIVQMPKGIPVATFAIGAAGAANAALFAVALLANEDPALRQQLEQFRAQQTAAARAMVVPPV